MLRTYELSAEARSMLTELRDFIRDGVTDEQFTMNSWLGGNAGSDVNPIKDGRTGPFGLWGERYVRLRRGVCGCVAGIARMYFDRSIPDDVHDTPDVASRMLDLPAGLGDALFTPEPPDSFRPSHCNRLALYYQSLGRTRGINVLTTLLERGVVTWDFGENNQQPEPEPVTATFTGDPSLEEVMAVVEKVLKPA